MELREGNGPFQLAVSVVIKWRLVRSVVLLILVPLLR